MESILILDAGIEMLRLALGSPQGSGWTTCSGLRGTLQSCGNFNLDVRYRNLNPIQPTGFRHEVQKQLWRRIPTLLDSLVVGIELYKLVSPPPSSHARRWKHHEFPLDQISVAYAEATVCSMVKSL